MRNADSRRVVKLICAALDLRKSAGNFKINGNIECPRFYPNKTLKPAMLKRYSVSVVCDHFISNAVPTVEIVDKFKTTLYYFFKKY